MDLGLAGKTAIVTGGGSNIGRRIVLTLAEEGANITIADIDEKQAQKVADEANALKKGGKTIAVKTDATSTDSVNAMVKKTTDTFGRVDILVNNLGWDEFYLFVETAPELWEKIININYKSVLTCVKGVLPPMTNQKYGRIVNVGSDAGRMGEYREAVYAGCKGAMIAFSKTIAREAGRYGITSNTICPGVTVPEKAEDTGELSMWKSGIGTTFTPDVQEKAAKSYALRRLGKPEDIANAVAFLASDRASFITGQTLSVSGGYTMI